MARVLISHVVELGLAEADVVLGLRGGQPEILEPAAAIRPDDLKGLYQ